MVSAWRPSSTTLASRTAKRTRSTNASGLLPCETLLPAKSLLTTTTSTTPSPARILLATAAPMPAARPCFPKKKSRATNAFCSGARIAVRFARSKRVAAPSGSGVAGSQTERQREDRRNLPGSPSSPQSDSSDHGDLARFLQFRRFHVGRVERPYVFYFLPEGRCCL